MWKRRYLIIPSLFYHIGKTLSYMIKNASGEGEAEFPAAKVGNN